MEPSLPLVASVDGICENLERYIPKLVTLETLASSPGRYIPALKYILKSYEEDHEAASANKMAAASGTIPRLFSLAPKPSMYWRFVSINAELLSSLLGLRAPANPGEYQRVFEEVLSFAPVGMTR